MTIGTCYPINCTFPLDTVRVNSANKCLNFLPCIALCCIEIIDGASNFDPQQNQWTGAEVFKWYTPSQQEYTKLSW